MSDDFSDLAGEPARKPKKGRRGFNAGSSARTWLTAKVPHEVYYAVLAEAKRIGKRTNDVVAALVTQWARDCALADRLKAQQAKKNPPG